MTETITLTIEIDVEAEYTPAERGCRGEFGEPLAPDYPASWEIVGAYTDNGDDFDLTPEQEKKALEQFENLEL